MKRRISTEGILLPILLLVLMLVLGQNTLLAQSSVTVTVTNVSDAVNGSTSNIASLISNPGPDGISFREALYAANGTAGEKTMTFHSSLRGDTITFVADGELLFLSSGELTIDGDIDEDGDPDITFDGHLGQEGPSINGLCITSSDNTITGLDFYDFRFAAILIVCPDAQCATKLFANNKIINNTISCQRGMGIDIEPLGVLPVEKSPSLSDITWQGILIQGNTIITEDNAIRIASAVGGGDGNQMLNFTISDNYLSSQIHAALDLIVADVNSTDFGIPGPTDYSDENLIDTLIVTNNVIDDSRFGIHIINANFGNSQNALQNVKINRNIFKKIQLGAISFSTADAEGEKATESNLIANVEITHNTLTQIWEGIFLGGGFQGSGVGANNNRVENVLIAENEIYDCTTSGVVLTGGSSATEEISGNILDSIIISENYIDQRINSGSGTGISIVGASTNSNGSASQNLVRLQVLNNRISNNGTGMQVYGGDGPGAEDNQVILDKVQGNTLVNNTVLWDIQDNINGAANNEVTGWVPTPTSSQLTFQVGMCVQLATEEFVPEAGDIVVVRGGFNNWSGENEVLQDPDGDKIYTGIFDITGGANSFVEYKYVIHRANGGDVWEGNVNPNNTSGNRTFTLTDTVEVIPLEFFNAAAGTVSQPIFSPSPGTYTEAIEVDIRSCGMSEATIHYTTDSSIPTESSPVFTSAIHIDTTMTIKARAYLHNWTPSEVATATYTIDIETAVDGDDLSEIPRDFALAQNYPNPFNPTTTIQFDLPKASHVTIRIYDILGHEVKTLAAEKYQPGSHSVIWDGKDDKGLPLASGTYLVRMRAGDFVKVKKMLLLK